jgi:hypothetical protein
MSRGNHRILGKPMDNPIDEQPTMIIYPPVIKHGVLEHLSFVDDFSNFSS